MSASTQGIGSDLAKVDAYENTAADYEELPEITAEEMARAVLHVNGAPVRDGLPKSEQTKEQITLRLDRDIIQHFRKLGAGWQGLINDALRRSMRG